MKETFPESSGRKLGSESLIDKLWRWFIAPSPKITEPDQRRQASLLSGFLIGTIFLSIITELLTIAFIEWKNYTGYRQTIIIMIFLGCIYGISRTYRVRMAAILTVIVASAGVYFIGWSEPKSVLGGIFDFMILPLWLGSLYLSLGGLAILIIGSLLLILLFPFLTPLVTMDDVLVGPFAYIFTTSILLIIITHHRNDLEQDRRKELTEKEELSRREAARSETLLRVAERLNAQLDLDTLLNAISEEVTHALGTPVSLVALYDQKQQAFYSTTAVGIPPGIVESMSLFPKDLFDRTIKNFGKVVELPDLQAFPNLPNLDEFKRLDLRSLAFVTMEYDHELIGSLIAITVGERRTFAVDELLL
jgi:hypothetical protein